MLRYEANEVKHQDFDEKRFRFPSFAWQANNVDSFQKKQRWDPWKKLRLLFESDFPWSIFGCSSMTSFSDLRKFALKWKNLTEIWGIFDEFLGHIFFDEFWGWIYVKKLSRVIWWIDSPSNFRISMSVLTVLPLFSLGRKSEDGQMRCLRQLSCLEFTPWLG